MKIADYQYDLEFDWLLKNNYENLFKFESDF